MLSSSMLFTSSQLLAEMSSLAFASDDVWVQKKIQCDKYLSNHIKKKVKQKIKFI